MLRIAISESNRRDREPLEGILKHIPGITVEGSVDSYSALINLADLSKPQIIFMSADGSDVAQTVAKLESICPKVFIILTTTFTEINRNMLEIFVFYHLLKPFTAGHVEAVINRIKMIVSDYANTGLAADRSPPPANNSGMAQKKLMVQSDDGFILINTHDILMIKKEDRRTGIFTSTDVHWINESLDRLEARLSKNFYRSHKGFIVNVDHVNGIFSLGNRSHMVKFRSTKATALITAEKLKLFQLLYCSEKEA